MLRDPQQGELEKKFAKNHGEDDDDENNEQRLSIREDDPSYQEKTEENVTKYHEEDHVDSVKEKSVVSDQQLVRSIKPYVQHHIRREFFRLGN